MTDLDTLQEITRAQYDRQRQSFQKILTEETALRDELARLDALNAQARADTDQTQRALGADLMWQGWVGRAKTQLNMKLARVLAVKEHHQIMVRKAYGKVLVVEELQTDAKKQKNQRTAKRALDQAIDGSLF